MVRSKAFNKKSQAKGVDFKKFKRKLGRKLPPPKNTTNTEIKSKAIILPEQSIASDKVGLALSKKGQSLKELLQQTSHHNVKVRRDALLGIREILLKEAAELKDHKLAIMEKLRERINDDDRLVRETLYQLFKSIIFPGCKEDNQGALASVIMTYIFNAMTHLAIDVRLMAFKFCDLVIENFPSVFSSFAEKVLDNYMDILQKIQFHSEDRSKLKITFSGLVRCLSLLPSNESESYSSEQKIAEKLVLHAFEMDVPEEPIVHIKIIGKLKVLVPVLVNCVNKLISVIHAQRVLDPHAFDCILSVLQSIELVVRYCVYVISKNQDLCTFLRNQMFPSLLLDLEKLFAVFPLRPVDYLHEKDDQRYFVLNTVISQIYYTFRLQICPSLDLPDEFLDFLVAEISKICSVDLSDRGLYEKHLVLLVPVVPGLVASVDWNHKHALLQAFTTTFKNCYADSSMKMACLKAVKEMLTSEEESLYLDADDIEMLEYQKIWIREIGLLLNSFGNGQSAKLHEVLHLLVLLGQVGLRNSALAEVFEKLQDEFEKYFCICTDKGDRCYGSFLELPEDCQFVSICCLSYFNSLKGELVASLALCCLSHSLNPSILSQIVGVFQSSYRDGHVDIADYISFCVTLLSQYEVTPEETSNTMGTEAVSSCQKTFRFVTGLILTFLNQMGDQCLLLKMLENFVLDILSQKLPLENTCALMKMLLEVDSKPTKLSVENTIKLGDVVTSYMIDVALLFPNHDKERRGSESSCTCRYYLVPCIHLLDRSSILMKHMLTQMGSFIGKSCELPLLRDTQLKLDYPRKIKAVLCFFSMMSMDPKMRRSLFLCKKEIDNILQSIRLIQSSIGNMSIEQRAKVESTVESLNGVIREAASVKSF